MTVNHNYIFRKRHTKYIFLFINNYFLDMLSFIAFDE